MLLWRTDPNDPTVAPSGVAAEITKLKRYTQYPPPNGFFWQHRSVIPTQKDPRMNFDTKLLRALQQPIGIGRHVFIRSKTDLSIIAPLNNVHGHVGREETQSSRQKICR